MQTKQQANKAQLRTMLNDCIEMKAKQSNLISSEYHFDSLASKIVDKINQLEIAILDCINDLND